MATLPGMATRRRMVMAVGGFAFGPGIDSLMAADPSPRLFAKSWIVVDAATCIPLAAFNADEERPVASTQKLMTGLLVAERGGLSDWITVAQSDTLVAPTKIGIKTGEKYRRIDLLKALLVKSGNDIAHCLGREHSGSEAAFGARMTARARELGMAHTRFANASGLPDPHQFSTARDMARLALHIRRSHEVAPVIFGITRMRETLFRFASGKSLRLVNTNKLLDRLPGCTGMKTGYTNLSGRCLISSVRRDNREIIAVVLGSDSKHIWNDSQSLLEWGLRQH